PITDLRWLDYYFKEIEEAQMIFKDRGLNVKTGLEVGFSIDSCRIIEKAIDNFPFDFILGAVHCLDHISLA
ncbi:MAG: histidinol phosphate phosphatase, partial [Firmicutes bacterium]|nr:histidinol phosphate phosphatase [Bacillota bacterium]